MAYVDSFAYGMLVNAGYTVTFYGDPNAPGNNYYDIDWS